MKLINILTGFLVLTCALWVITARMATIKAVAQKDYCAKKCLKEIAIKDAEIEELTRKLLKAEAVEDWLLLIEYVLPEIKRNEMAKHTAAAARSLRRYLRENEGVQIEDSIISK